MADYYLPTDRAEFQQAYGLWLESRRRDAGLSQTALAVEIGIHRNTLHRWECGEGVPTTFQHTLLEQVFRRYEAAPEKRRAPSAKKFPTAIACPG